MDGHVLIAVGDHPALDLLNSTARPGTETVELLGGGDAYLTWLEHAGLVSDAERRAAEARFAPDELAAVAAAAVDLREWFRAVLGGLHATAPGDSAALEPALAQLDGLLQAGRRRPVIHRADGAVEVGEEWRWETPAALLAPPAVAIADLLVNGRPDLIRRCQGAACTLWFYDRTKAHRRRWCSMALCGNRAKARAHRARRAVPAAG